MTFAVAAFVTGSYVRLLAVNRYPYRHGCDLPRTPFSRGRVWLCRLFWSLRKPLY
jgi:hypothetical protein